MTIQESIDQLVNILQSVDKDSFAENFPHIAEALDIDVSTIDNEDAEAMISAIQNAVTETVDEEDVQSVVEEIQKFFVEEKDEEEEDDEEEDEEEMDEKKKAKKESFFISASDLDIAEDTDAMFSGEELSEEFQEKAKTIFETAVVTKVNEKIAQIIEEYEDVIEEKVEEIENSYSAKLDEYLDYVVSEWTEENRIAIESGIKSEMNESLMSSLKTVLEEHYIELPDDKVDMYEELQVKVSELEEELNSTLEKNAKLKRELKESTKSDINDTIMEGLSEMQREKMAELLENVDVEEDDIDLQKYTKKAKMIRESYFPSTSQELNEDNRTDDVDAVELEEDTNSPVSRYAKALDRFRK